jgi:hypothetical protein
MDEYQIVRPFRVAISVWNKNKSLDFSTLLLDQLV